MLSYRGLAFIGLFRIASKAAGLSTTLEIET